MSQSGLMMLFFLLFFASANAQNNAFVHTKGKEIILPDGNPILIKGTNTGNWLVPEGYMFKFSKNYNSPTHIQTIINQLIGPDEAKKFWQTYKENYIQREDIQYMKASGMNTVRIPFHYKLFTNDEYMGAHSQEEGFRLLDSIIAWCREENLYAILDMHCAPGGQTGDNIDDSYGYPYLFESEESKQLTIEIWKKIAAHYENEKIIMGYDLLNEPIAHYFDNKDTLNKRLEPLYKRIVSAIRQVDKNHIIFLGGAQWNTNFDVFGKPFDSNLVYTFHLYWCDTTQAVIQRFVDFREKYNVPLFIGETGENTDEWVSSFRKLLERNNIGWTFWPFKKMKNTKGIMQFDMPATYQEIINYSEKVTPSYEDIRKCRPTDTKNIKLALSEFLKYCRFENCKPNPGYMKALGLKP